MPNIPITCIPSAQLLSGTTTRIPFTLVPFASAFSPLSIGSIALWLDGLDPAGTGTYPSAGATVST